MSKDLTSLRTFLKSCMEFPNFCKDGGQAYAYGRKILHRNGMSRAQIYSMHSILQHCIDKEFQLVGSCDLKATSIAMETLIHLLNVETHRENENEKRSYNNLKSLVNVKYFPQLVEPQKYMNMFARHGRKFGDWIKELKRKKPSSRGKRSTPVSRSRRSNPFSLHVFLDAFPKSDGNYTTTPSALVGNY